MTLRHAEVVLEDGIVAEMAVSVTFGASLFGAQIDNCCDRSEYATFSILSATAVREMTVSVPFGAPRSGVPVTLCRRPIVDHIAGTGHGRGFSTNATLNSRWTGAMVNVKLHGASRARIFEYVMLETSSCSMSNKLLCVWSFIAASLNT